ncbi:MAG: flippase [Nitrospirae bacterium]|nr:flippase [Nitrospirota bacterium]
MRSLTAIKNILFSFVNNLLTLLNGVVLSVIIARLLGPQNLGAFSLVTWTVSIALLFVNLGIVMSLKKHVAEYEGQNDRRSISGVINFMLNIRIIAALAVTAVLIIFSGPIACFFNLPDAQRYFIWAAISILPSAVGQIFGASLTGIQKYQYSMWINLVMTPLEFGLSLAVLLAGYGVIGLLLVVTFTSTIGFFANYWAARREGLLDRSARLAPKVRSEITKFNLGVTAMNFLDAIVWQRSEVFFLGKFRSLQEVGFYSLAFGFTTTAVSFFASSISNVLIPIHSQAFGTKDHDGMGRIYQKSIQYLSLVSLPLAIGGAVLADRIVLMMYGAQYLPAASAMAILFLSSAGARIGAGLASVMYSANLVHIKIYTALIWTVLNITLDLLLIPNHGVMGAVIANSTTQLLGVFTGPFIIYYFFRFSFPIAAFLRAAASALMMGAVVWLLKGFFPGTGGLLALVAIGAVIYLVMVVLFRAVSSGDVDVLIRIGDRLPQFVQGKYRTVMGFVSRAVA